MPPEKDISDAQLKESMERKSRALLASSKIFLKTIGGQERVGLSQRSEVWNAAFNVNLICSDLNAQIFFCGISDDLWAKRLASRTLATLIFEALHDLPEMFGNRFWKTCAQSGATEEEIRNLRNELKGIGALERANSKSLKTIRTIAGAHRDHDTMKFFDVLASTNPTKLIHLAVALNSALLNIANAVKPILAKVGKETHRRSPHAH